MRLTQILPFQNAFLTPTKKDDKPAKPRPAEEDRGLSGVQVQSVTPRRDDGADDQPPDREPPSRGLDIKV